MRTAVRIGASIAAGLSGLLIVWRVLHGPFVLVRSPLNAESIFALAILILVIFEQGSQNAPARPIEPVDWRALLSLAGIVAVAFAASSHDYFLSDDFIMLRHAREAGSSFHSFTTGGGDGFFRPLIYESFRLTSPWAAADPLRWHLVGFVIHALNSMLVLLLARALGLARFAAWFTGALFAIHATRPETVVWITGRFDLLATFFVLLALTLFLHEHRWLALIAMVAGLLCKESAYACPLLLALLAPRRWRALIPFFAAAAALFLYRFWLFGNIGGYKTASGQPQALSVGPLSILKALVLRLWAVLFFPVNWSISPGVLLGIAMAAYIGALLWLFIAGTASPSQRMVFVAIGFVILAALPPVQQLLIGPDLQKARYVYLPSVGFCLLLALFVQRRRTAAVILAFNAVALFHNLTAWHNAAALTKSACVAATAGELDRARLPAVPGVYLLENGLPECAQMAAK